MEEEKKLLSRINQKTEKPADEGGGEEDEGRKDIYLTDDHDH